MSNCSTQWRQQQNCLFVVAERHSLRGLDWTRLDSTIYRVGYRYLSTNKRSNDTKNELHQKDNAIKIQDGNIFRIQNDCDSVWQVTTEDVVKSRNRWPNLDCPLASKHCCAISLFSHRAFEPFIFLSHRHRGSYLYLLLYIPLPEEKTYIYFSYDVNYIPYVQCLDAITLFFL